MHYSVLLDKDILPTKIMAAQPFQDSAEGAEADLWHVAGTMPFKYFHPFPNRKKGPFLTLGYRLHVLAVLMLEFPETINNV